MTSVDMLEGAALIEDYFETNSDQIDVPDASSQIILIEPFCVESDTVFKFQLAATFNSA